MTLVRPGLLALLVPMMTACATDATSACPDLTGEYRARAESGVELASVLSIASAGSVTLTSRQDELNAVSGGSRKVLVRGRDFECSSAGLSLLAPMTGGYAIPGVIAEHVDRYYTLSKARDGSLIGRATDKERVKFIGPELTGRGQPGPESRWLPVSHR